MSGDRQTVRQNRVLLDAAQLILKAYGKRNADPLDAMKKVEKAIKRERRKLATAQKASIGH